MQHQEKACVMFVVPKGRFFVAMFYHIPIEVLLSIGAVRGVKLKLVGQVGSGGAGSGWIGRGRVG